MGFRDGGGTNWISPIPQPKQTYQPWLLMQLGWEVRSKHQNRKPEKATQKKKKGWKKPQAQEDERCISFCPHINAVGALQLICWLVCAFVQFTIVVGSRMW